MNFQATLLRVVLGVVLCVASARAIINGQVDTFEDGTSNGWGNGVFGDLEVRATGGPSGVGDHFIVISANGFGSASGGRVTGFNLTTWIGNYISANVGAIEMDLQCIDLPGGGHLNIRIGLRTETGLLGTSGEACYVSSASFPLAKDGQWHHAIFYFASLSPVAALPLQGGGPPLPLATVLQNPGQIRIVSSAAGDAFRGDDAIITTLGIDNIRAVTGLDVTSMTRLANKNVQLNFKGAPGITYTIQATSDLTQSFTTIGTAAAATDGTFQFLDTNAPAFTQRFYRAIFTYPISRPAAGRASSGSGGATSRTPASPSASRR
jgi:hypothetical protein